MKKNNPNTPILIREATGVAPKVWARYGMVDERATMMIAADMSTALGKEKFEELSGMYQHIGQ